MDQFGLYLMQLELLCLEDYILTNVLNLTVDAEDREVFVPANPLVPVQSNKADDQFDLIDALPQMPRYEHVFVAVMRERQEVKAAAVAGPFTGNMQLKDVA